ncbi:hypothetical protein [Arthrobacter sp. HY1533]|uniref:hypothetical protein n=1 Tax=Arthrobacter sp. HY1533 TaxID=2970919 RepID=UPI0022BA0342|nr:hypothetical protein [Arthrobacter sp. HY1533]
MDNPTEPLEQSGSTHHTPAGYFADPDGDTFPPAEPGTETQTEEDPTGAAGSGRHPARIGTIVWGTVVLVAGILVILSSQLSINLDPGLTAMWLLLGAGAAMVAGGAVKLLRRKQP